MLHLGSAHGALALQKQFAIHLHYPFWSFKPTLRTCPLKKSKQSRVSLSLLSTHCVMTPAFQREVITLGPHGYSISLSYALSWNNECGVELLIAAVVPTHKALGDPQIPWMSQQPMIQNHWLATSQGLFSSVGRPPMYKSLVWYNQSYKSLFWQSTKLSFIGWCWPRLTRSTTHRWIDSIG